MSSPPRASLLSSLRRLRHLRRPIGLTLAVISWLPVFIFVQDHFARILPVNGPSMHPLLNRAFDASGARDRVLVWQHRASEDLHRGSVIALRSPMAPERLLVKRVTAVEGDRVRAGTPYPRAEETVPMGHVWVEGENADPRKSSDSRNFGPVPRALVVGKVVAVVWPWKHASLVRWQDWEADGAHSRVET